MNLDMRKKRASMYLEKEVFDYVKDWSINNYMPINAAIEDILEKILVESSGRQIEQPVSENAERKIFGMQISEKAEDLFRTLAPLMKDKSRSGILRKAVFFLKQKGFRGPGKGR